LVPVKEIVVSLALVTDSVTGKLVAAASYVYVQLATFVAAHVNRELSILTVISTASVPMSSAFVKHST